MRSLLHPGTRRSANDAFDLDAGTKTKVLKLNGATTNSARLILILDNILNRLMVPPHLAKKQGYLGAIEVHGRDFDHAVGSFPHRQALP